MDWPILLGALVVFTYVYPPFEVWRKVRQRIPGTFEPYDESRFHANDATRGTLRDWIATLVAEGFAVVADVLWDGPRKRVVLMRHPETGEEGLLFGMVTANVADHASVTFYGHFLDGRELDVGNPPLPRTFAAGPGKRDLRFPQVRDVRRLLQVYRALERRDYSATSRRQPDLPPLEALSRNLVLEFESEQVASGLFQAGDHPGEYRPTLLGAYRMSWKLQVPFVQIRTWLARLHAARMLRELGL